MVARKAKGVLVLLVLGFAWVALFYYPSDNVAVAVGEIASNCAGNNFATGEDIGGNMVCSLVNYSQIVGHIAGLNNETASNPSACATHNFLTQVVESALGALTLTCVQPSYADLTGHVGTPNETASSPSACSAHNFLTRVVESALGVLTLTCAQPAYSDLTGHVGTANETSSSPSACGAGNKLTQVTESAAGVVTLVCAQDVNAAFSSNTSTCTISSASANLGAFTTAPTYTTQGATYLHTIVVTLNFEIDPPAAANINTAYTFAYGTSSAPGCAAANGGTSVGNTYTVVDVGELGSGTFPGKWPESVTVVITGLAGSTTYWFDLKVTDSSAASWIYLKPQISVLEY